jgi:endonuclease/exonuclease/phosphatase family metal-dependent hydrolase
MDQVHVATLNLRNLADRWDERLPLLLADMAALQPDLMGLQEVVYPAQQDRLLGAAGGGHYRAIRGWAGRPEYGNSILAREQLEAGEPERVDLGHERSATRIALQLPGGGRLVFAVTHLHHLVPDDAVRDEQARGIVDWLDGGTRDAGATIVVGDFNADPAEPAYARMLAAGFRSAYAEANGQEPAVTWPSGLQGPAIDDDGEPGCLDYIWVRGAVRVVSARLVFDRPAVDDPGLFPSDHFGVAARVEVG